MGDFSEESNTFHYDLKDGWKPIAYPYSGPDDVGLKAELKSIGFSEHPSSKIGSDGSFEVKWYRPSGEAAAHYPHLLTVDNSSDLWFVFTSDFPSAIELFHKLSAIAQSALVNDVHEDIQGTMVQERGKTEDHEREVFRNREERRSGGGIETPG